MSVRMVGIVLWALLLMLRLRAASGFRVPTTAATSSAFATGTRWGGVRQQNLRQGGAAGEGTGRSLSRLFGTHRIVFLGTPDVAARSLELLHAAQKDKEFEIVAVVSQPPAPSGRNKKLTPSPVHALAETLKIPLHTPESAKDEAFLTILEELAPDLCITAAYGNFLPKRFLAIPKHGTLNIHPSLLPKYRGAAPVQRCLENGDAESGVSVAVTVLKMDAGPLLKQIRVTLTGDEKAPEFLLKMFEAGTQALLSVLPDYFAGKAEKVPQDDSQATPANKLNVTEARVDFASMSAAEVHNRGRGFAGWPGVWSSFSVDGSPEGSEERIKIITTTLLPSEQPVSSDDANLCTLAKHTFQQQQEGEGAKMVTKDVLKVVCADGSVLGILELQPPSKKVMDAKSYVNGLRGAAVRWVSPA